MPRPYHEYVGAKLWQLWELCPNRENFDGLRIW